VGGAKRNPPDQQIAEYFNPAGVEKGGFRFAAPTLHSCAHIPELPDISILRELKKVGFASLHPPYIPVPTFLKRRIF